MQRVLSTSICLVVACGIVVVGTAGSGDQPADAVTVACLAEQREQHPKVRRKEFLGLPVSDFAGAVRVKDARIKSGNATNATFLRQNAVPKSLDPRANAGNRSDPGDDGSAAAHAATLFARASTYVFIQRNVLLATS
jgi:hypothetical protein